ncbi:MAG TPA: hypothetical protein VET30_09360 [Pseudoxanthomonas sp.]|nr:hypothetical protein [Pseudoxanthomonas sp.]
MRLLALLGLATISLSVAAGPDLEYAEAKALADSDENSLPEEQSSKLVAAQGELMNSGIAACATPNPDFSAFVVAMELDAGGKVIRTWLQGDSPLAICFRKHVAAGALTPPPRAPFYSFIELSFSK